jgi:hypothetical protein
MNHEQGSEIITMKQRIAQLSDEALVAEVKRFELIDHELSDKKKAYGDALVQEWERRVEKRRVCDYDYFSWRLREPGDQRCAHCHGTGSFVRVTYVDAPEGGVPVHPDCVREFFERSVYNTLPETMTGKEICELCGKPNANVAILRAGMDAVTYRHSECDARGR